jgi:RNA polymerase subunit RPABC4/transcription elongation factor Spt4
MAFCSNCGTKLEDGAKFCPSCGTPAEGTLAAPKSVIGKVGDIRKCPACGAEVPSMTAICPSCGHEFNSTQVSNTVKAFVEQINALDMEIVIEKRNQSKKVGSLGKKIGYVILNIFTWAIPFILRTLKRIFFPVVPQLLPSEQKKKSHIENFVVPNNREDIMEFVIFSSTRLESEMNTSGKSINDLGLANMWAKVWSDKCKQVTAKAGVVLSGDKNALATINGLMDKPQKMVVRARQKELIKLIAVVGIVIIAVVAIGFNVLGVGVEVPALTNIPPNAIFIRGDFDGYLKSVDNGATITSRNEGTELSILISVEVIKPITPTVEKQLADFIKSKDWEAIDCTYELYVSYFSGSWIGISGFEVEGYGSDFKLDEKNVESIISSLLKMEPGEIKNISIPLSPGGDTAGGKKRNSAKLMRQEDLEFIISLGYRVKNNVIGKTEYIEIN